MKSSAKTKAMYSIENVRSHHHARDSRNLRNLHEGKKREKISTKYSGPEEQHAITRAAGNAEKPKNESDMGELRGGKG